MPSMKPRLDTITPCPTYEYFCPENGRSVEVLHGMSTTLSTWGEVCAAQDLEPGDTPTHTRVEKLLGTTKRG